jgi:curved DNA-binding protein CbpA
MEQVLEHHKTVRDAAADWVILENVPGSSAPMRVRVLETNDSGLCVELAAKVAVDTVVLVKGEASDPLLAGKVRARVVRCVALPEGGYNAGLAYEGGSEPSRKAAPAEAVPDYYEVLQVNVKADPETIHRVFRMMAQRFHPDNVETGNGETFRAMLEAYKVLSDPERRAAYDVNLQGYRQARWRLFDETEAAVGKRAEKSKRRGVLELLYTARMQQPNKAALGLPELEELLGCPREHLEFSLWYLKENALVARADNGRFTITAKGVDRVEADEAEQLLNHRLLAAGNGEGPAGSGPAFSRRNAPAEAGATTELR